MEGTAVNQGTEITAENGREGNYSSKNKPGLKEDILSII